MVVKLYMIILAVILGGIVVHAPLSVAFGTLFPGWELVIKSWKEILLLVAMFLALGIVTKRRLWTELAGDWVFRLIVAYGALHILLAVFIPSSSVALFAGLAIDLRYVLFFALVYVLIKVAPQYSRLFICIGVAGAIIVVGFAGIQLFLPPDFLSRIGYGPHTIMPYLTVDKNPDYIRINSTLRGPNPLGAYAGMVLALLTAAVLRTKWWVNSRTIVAGVTAFAVCSLLALWNSHSRSAWIGAVLAVGIVLAATILRKLSRKTWIITSAIVFALVGALVVGRDSSFVSNVFLHENPSGGSQISSNDGHAESLQDGVNRFIHRPFGAGIGSTGSASLQGESPVIIENQFLFIAHETGWLGLILFLAIFVIIMLRLWQKRKDWLALGVFASGVGLSVVGMLLPVWADDTVSIVWWGLAAVALVGGKNERKKTKQKTA